MLNMNTWMLLEGAKAALIGWLGYAVISKNSFQPWCSQCATYLCEVSLSYWNKELDVRLFKKSHREILLLRWASLKLNFISVIISHNHIALPVLEKG